MSSSGLKKSSVSAGGARNYKVRDQNGSDAAHGNVCLQVKNVSM